MKKIVTLLLSFVLFASLVFPVSATGSGEVIYSGELTFENGLRAVETVTVYFSGRASTVTADREMSLYDGDTLVAYIRFEATYRYDGSTVSVVSKSVTNTNTYDGWEYVQNSFTSSGGTVTLDAKITKWFIFNTPFSMTLSCDKDGNISYT